MTSTCIYGVKSNTPSIDGKFHYVYRITNLVENKHYYGKRSSKINPHLDIGIEYFSSSRDKEFISDQKNNPQNYKYKIVHICEFSNFAQERESIIHNKFSVDKNPSFYNIVKSSSNSIGFDPSSKAYVIDKNGKKFYVYRNDNRIKSGELFYPNKGTVIVKDKSGKIFRVKLSDPRYISGELIHQNKGKPGNENQKLAASKSSSNTIPIVDMKGNKYRIKIDDPGYGILYKHVATKYVLYRKESGETFWGTKNCPSREKLFVLYENNGRKTKFIFHTPWGKYESSWEAAKNITELKLSDIKFMCRFLDTVITTRHTNILKIFPDSVGKTFEDLGFYRIKR